MTPRQREPGPEPWAVAAASRAGFSRLASASEPSPARPRNVRRLIAVPGGSPEFMTGSFRLGEDSLDHAPGDVGQAGVQALEFDCEAGVFDAQEPEHGGMQVMDVH